MGEKTFVAIYIAGAENALLLAFPRLRPRPVAGLPRGCGPGRPSGIARTWFPLLVLVASAAPLALTTAGSHAENCLIITFAPSVSSTSFRKLIHSLRSAQET